MFPHAREQVGSAVAYITGLIIQKLLLQNEYLAAENCILRAHLRRLGIQGVARL